MGQLWYEVLQLQANLSPSDIAQRLDEAQQTQLILAMHPHGIVPFQAVLWSAYCHQYFQDTADPTRALYGFGAAADIVQHVPLLRNLLAWLTAGGAAYRTLREGLVEGKCASANPRTPRHLFILPGGIAEIFVSTPGRHAIVFNSRKGLVRLSLETGARLVPCYVFGGTDFFHNLATSQSPLARLSRYVRAGVNF
ncbi:MAG: hypothetical protein EOO70_06495 [Myxococcaceae bacterium]|nr:MAG: hypothetical protein EOO70_06495 [Myxococcaceae bacterium]